MNEPAESPAGFFCGSMTLPVGRATSELLELRGRMGLPVERDLLDFQNVKSAND